MLWLLNFLLKGTKATWLVTDLVEVQVPFVTSQRAHFQG